MSVSNTIILKLSPMVLLRHFKMVEIYDYRNPKLCENDSKEDAFQHKNELK